MFVNKTPGWTQVAWNWVIVVHQQRYATSQCYIFRQKRYSFPPNPFLPKLTYWNFLSWNSYYPILLHTLLDTSTQYTRKMVQNAKSVLKAINKLKTNLQHHLPIIFIQKKTNQMRLFQITGTLPHIHKSKMTSNCPQNSLWAIRAHFPFFWKILFLMIPGAMHRTIP